MCGFKLYFHFLATFKKISKKLRRISREGCLLILNNQSRITDGEGGLGVSRKFFYRCVHEVLHIASDLDGFFLTT